MLIILATFTIPIIFTIRFEDGEKNVKETGETVKNIGNNELDEEKKENFAQNGASPLGDGRSVLYSCCWKHECSHVYLNTRYKYNYNNKY